MRKKLEKAIAGTEKVIGRIKKREEKARAKWTKGYQRFLQASANLAEIKNNTTQRAQKLKNTILSWPNDTIELTKERDAARAEIAAAEAKLQTQRTELAVLLERLGNIDRRTDDIVDQVFTLNNAVVSALRTRNEYLTANVYDMLVDEDGTLHGQVTLTSTDGLRRVRALVNTIARIDTTLAREAKAHIDAFRARFSTTTDNEADETSRALISILENVLFERLSFKVGPDLYRFITIDIDANAFPELKQAQHLLRHSLRSEKTNSYIRLWKRPSTSEPWKEVKLS